MSNLIRRYSFLTKNILGSNFRRPGYPYKLTYAVTYKCNSRCKTCAIWQRPAGDELRTEEIRTFFKKSNKFSWIDLTGGEVFLREDFPEIVDVILTECRDLCLLHFPTNGLLTGRIVETVASISKLKPSKLIITVSLDGDEVLNDSIRGIPGGWRRQLETFRALHAMPGIQTVLGMTLSPYNFDKFEPTFRSVKKECPWLRYEDFHVNLAHVSSHFYGNEDLEVAKMPLDVVVAEIKHYMKTRGAPLGPVSFLEREYLKRVEPYLRSGRTPVRCQALRASCFVDPYGNVFPCSMYDIVVGNLRNAAYDLGMIWQSDACRAIQEEIWDFKCPQCWTPCEAYQSVLGSLLRKKPLTP